MPCLPIASVPALCSKTPSLKIYLGTVGSVSLSPALVLQLQGLLSLAGANWTVELLYMPCLVPFVLVSCVALVVFRADMHQAGATWKEPFSSAWNKLKGMPSFAGRPCLPCGTVMLTPGY
jgi:L-lactate permease